MARDGLYAHQVFCFMRDAQRQADSPSLCITHLESVFVDSIQNRPRYTWPDALNIASQVWPSQIRVVIKNEG